MIILLGILTLITILLIVFPLYNRRPVIFKEMEVLILLLLLSTIVALWTHPIVLVLALVIGTVIYYNHHWIVYGVSRENTVLALQKAVIATRSQNREVEESIQINGDLSVKTYRLGSSISYIKFSRLTNIDSKKTKLTKNVFYKFIQNYKLN